MNLLQRLFEEGGHTSSLMHFFVEIWYWCWWKHEFTLSLSFGLVSERMDAKKKDPSVRFLFFFFFFLYRVGELMSYRAMDSKNNSTFWLECNNFWVSVLSGKEKRATNEFERKKIAMNSNVAIGQHKRDINEQKKVTATTTTATAAPWKRSLKIQLMSALCVWFNRQTVHSDCATHKL